MEPRDRLATLGREVLGADGEREGAGWGEHESATVGGLTLHVCDRGVWLRGSLGRSAPSKQRTPR
jgi:hypothetical protein